MDENERNKLIDRSLELMESPFNFEAIGAMTKGQRQVTLDAIARAHRAYRHGLKRKFQPWGGPPNENVLELIVKDIARKEMKR
jgi:hypothetical protein